MKPPDRYSPSYRKDELTTIFQHARRGESLCYVDVYKRQVPDLSTTERSLGAAGASPVLTWVDSTVADEVAFFRKRTAIDVELDQRCDDIQARIHEEWLRRLIRHYLKNAQKHLTSTRKPHIVVRTRVDDAMMTVYVEDNGCLLYTSRCV